MLPKIFTRALERHQIDTLLTSYCLKLKLISLKFTGELCGMTLKNDAIIEEGLTFQFKIDMRNLTNFNLSTRKSQKFVL